MVRIARYSMAGDHVQLFLGYTYENILLDVDQSQINPIVRCSMNQIRDGNRVQSSYWFRKPNIFVIHRPKSRAPSTFTTIEL